MKINLKFILILIIFIALQIVWLNHIQLPGRFIPVIYTFPLLILPLNKNENVQLLLAFLVGLSLDIFSNTLGVFTVTTVFITYFRKVFFLYFKNKNKSLEDITPHKIDFGLKMLYYGIFSFITIFMIYFLESFQISFIYHHFIHIFINVIISILIILFIDYLFLSTE